MTITGRLAVARITFHVDINIGDPVQPMPQQVVLPRVLGGHIKLTGYPLPMVYAEKIVTALQRGAANTRWRDFADVYALCRQHSADGDEVHQSINTVAAYRQVKITLLSTALDGYAGLGQPRWVTWRRRQRLEDRLPQDFAEVLRAVFRFADPALSGSAKGRTWNAGSLTWR